MMRDPQTALKAFRVAELKEALKQLNLPVNGLKSDLLARLQAALASSVEPSAAAAARVVLQVYQNNMSWGDNVSSGGWRGASQGAAAAPPVKQGPAIVVRAPPPAARTQKNHC